MNAKNTARKLSRTQILVAVRPEILIALTIETAIQENPNYLVENPGVVSMIHALALGEEQIGKTIVKAMEAAGNFDRSTKDRVQDAEQYMGNVARFLNPAGRAWGIYLNSLVAHVRPDDFKPQQVKTFGDGQQVKPLITIKGAVEFINAMAKTEVQIDGYEGQDQTVAQHVLNNVGSFGSPDNNVIGALLPSAIQTRGQLTQTTLVQVIKGLRHEGSNPQQDVPREVIETATQYHQTFGNGTHDDQTGRRGSRPHARS